MPRKLLATLTTVGVLSLLVGVAWAGPGGSASVDATAATSTESSLNSTAASVAASTDATVDANVGVASTSTTSGASTSTSVDASTSTSADASTSTTVASTTSTSLDDNDDNDSIVVAAQGTTVHTIPGVGTVTIQVVGNTLVLVNASAPGWSIEFDKLESDRIEVEFEAGDADAEFEARLENGQLRVRVEVDSD